MWQPMSSNASGAHGGPGVISRSLTMTSVTPVDRSERNLWALNVLCALALVSLDAVIPPRINVAVAYILLVFLSLW